MRAVDNNNNNNNLLSFVVAVPLWGGKLTTMKSIRQLQVRLYALANDCMDTDCCRRKLLPSPPASWHCSPFGKLLDRCSLQTRVTTGGEMAALVVWFYQRVASC